MNLKETTGKKLWMTLVSLCLIFIPVYLIFAEAPERVGDFTRIAPSEANFSTEKLEQVKQFLEKNGSDAFLGLYDGKVFFSWGAINKRFPVHSIRKAFLSALYGIFIDKGIIDVNKTLEELKIDDLNPALTKNEKKARIIDLLQSRSGVYHGAAAEAESMIKSRPEPGSHKPGSFFYYNNWDFNVLGTIFEQVTGKKIFSAFKREIARPLGMKHYSGSFEVIELKGQNLIDLPETDGMYWYERSKSIHPAYHFCMSAHDMALFGLLYLKNGFWNGKQIIPRNWIERSTRVKSIYSKEMGLGYGYLWYVLLEGQRENHAFFHTGGGIHLLAVFPQLKLVLVHRADAENPSGFTPQHLFQLWDMVLAARE